MKKFKYLFILLFFLVLLPFNVCALEYPELKSYSVYVYDKTDDNVLYEKNSNEIKSIASLTKIVTTYVAINKIDNLDQSVTITREIMNSVDPVASRAGLKVGDVVTYRDLLYASILPSGADATNALAILLSGSIDAFVNEMNDFVSNFNLENTHFVNVTGLDEDNHYSTANEIGVILSYVLDNELFREVFTTKEYTLSNGLTVHSTLYKYNGEDISSIIGSKTGFTGDAGYCISTLSVADSHDIVSILLDAPHLDGKFYNMVDSSTLVNFVSDSYKNQLLFEKNSLIVNLPVNFSKTSSYSVKSSIDVYKFLPNDYDTELFEAKYEGINELSFKNRKGDTIGKINYYYDNVLIDSEDVILNTELKISILKILKEYYWIGLIIILLITIPIVLKKIIRK